jgi:RNA polymerase sigma factor (sigma-70 family)
LGGAKRSGGVRISTGMGYGPATSVKRATREGLAKDARAEWHERASALYEDLRKPAVSLVRRAYGSAFSESEMDDVYSSAWLGTLRALERRHADLSDEEIRSYVLTAVANHASKEIRRRGRKPIAPLEAAGSVADTSDSLQDRAESDESRRLTRDLLSSLPPRRRAVMLLRYGWELDPSEVCGLVEGLSPRAYRKEITRGVDELVRRLKLVDEGAWCQEREPVLKAFAAGTASDDQALQAEQHMSHCRSCKEFVAKVTGHLHDLGSSILLPGALAGVNDHTSVADRLREFVDGARDHSLAPVARPETAEGVTVLTGARGAGAAGAGILAKLSGLGSGAKAALACTGGAFAASACVVAGVGPIALPGPADHAVKEATKNSPQLRRVAKDIRPLTPSGEAQPEPPSGPAPEGVRPAGEPTVAEETPPQTVLAPETPPTTQQFGVESSAAPAGSPPPQTSPSSGQGAVAQEFGP